MFLSGRFYRRLWRRRATGHTSATGLKLHSRPKPTIYAMQHHPKDGIHIYQALDNAAAAYTREHGGTQGVWPGKNQRSLPVRSDRRGQRCPRRDCQRKKYAWHNHGGGDCTSFGSALAGKPGSVIRRRLVK